MNERTGKLNSNDHNGPLVVPRQAAFFRFATPKTEFHPVPANYKSLESTTRRRVLLKFASGGQRVTVGLDIYGDVVMGRGQSDDDTPGADIDLSNLDAAKLGVSRRHALIRPTRNKLFLIDLESTNGSFVNTIPVGRGMAQEIKDGDSVAFAGLSFDIEFIELPDEEAEAATGEHHPELPPKSDQDPTDPWPQDKINAAIGGVGKNVVPDDAKSTQQMKIIHETPSPDDTSESEAKPGEQSVETLPPGSVPFVKSLGQPPTIPVTRKARLDKSADDDAEDTDTETTDD